MTRRPARDTDEDLVAIDDSDGGTESDSDLCDRCGCPREAHDDDGACVCGDCAHFVDP